MPFLTLTLNGETQGPNALPSRLHSKVAPTAVELNSNTAFFFFVFFFGPLSILVSGPAPPIRQDCSVGVVALLRGLGDGWRKKSAWLESVSSKSSSSVGQPAAIERSSDAPLGIAGALGPGGEGSGLALEKLPHETQSMLSKQAAPPVPYV